MEKFVILVPLALLMIITPVLSFSQIHISGPLCGILIDTTYIVDGDISVEAGDSLIIEAGAELLFVEGVGFSVRGFMNAIGAEDDSIYFIPIEEDSIWSGIYLYNSSLDHFDMEYCVIIGGINGIECYYGNLLLKNSSLRNNISGSGGAIDCKYSSIEIIDCTFIENSAGGYGGAIRLHDASSFISGCTFLNNTGLQGGAIRGVGGSHLISTCYIGGNNATDKGGGMCFYSVDTIEISSCIFLQNFASKNGGGLNINSSNEISINNCQIFGNVVADTFDYKKGGGLFIDGGNILITNTEIYNNLVISPWSYGGGVALENSDNCTIDSSHIHGNYSQYFGGGIRAEYVTLDISNSLIEDNYALQSHGGGTHFWLSEIILDNCIIRNNSGFDHGGGVYSANSNLFISNCEFSSNHTGFLGGGGGLFFNFDSLLTITNSVFHGNYANNGSAIETDHSANCVIKNSIFSENYNSEAIKFDDNDYKEISYSNFYNNDGNMGSIYYPPGFGVTNYTNLNDDSCDVYGNIFLDPLFYATVRDSAFYLTTNSPCIDAGDPSSPLDPDSTIVDIGAYFYNQNTWVGPKTLTVAPTTFSLYPPRPNPFNPTATLSFEIPKPGEVSLVVYDISGRQVAVLVDEFVSSGKHEAVVDGKDLSSGIYFSRLTVDGGQSMVKKLVLMK